MTPTAALSPAEVQAQSLTALRALVAMLGGSARAIESRTGLTNAQLFVLRQVASREQVSINALAALVHTRQNTVSSVVGRRAFRGLVRKGTAADDHRRVEVTITQQGREMLARAPESSTETLIAGLGALSPADAAALSAGLAALLDVLGVDASQAPLLFERA